MPKRNGYYRGSGRGRGFWYSGHGAGCRRNLSSTPGFEPLGRLYTTIFLNRLRLCTSESRNNLIDLRWMVGRHWFRPTSTDIKQTVRPGPWSDDPSTEQVQLAPSSLSVTPSMWQIDFVAPVVAALSP